VESAEHTAVKKLMTRLEASHLIFGAIGDFCVCRGEVAIGSSIANYLRSTTLGLRITSSFPTRQLAIGRRWEAAKVHLAVLAWRNDWPF